MANPLSLRFRNIMLDLETFGTGTNAAITSIGACAFDLESGEINTVDVLYVKVDLANSKHPGVIDASTVEWWMKQPDTARTELLSGKRWELGDALIILTGWLDRFGDGPLLLDRTLSLWSMPPSFDQRLIEEAYARYSLKPPYHYAVSCDVRTMRKLATSLGIQIPKMPVAHNALADAIQQAREVCEMYAAIRDKVRA